MEKVSIIIPIYNVEQYIEKCLKSLLNQTYENIEILAISDGTPDNSMEIVEKYAKLDSRINPIYKENGGYGSVLEYAIKKISSKYFLVCDPDDWLTDDAIEKLVDIAENNLVDIVIGDVYLTYQDEFNKTYRRTVVDGYPIIPKRVYNKNMIDNFVYMHASPHAKLYKTEIAKKISFPYKVSYTDNVLFLVFLNSASSAYYLDEALAYYYFDRPGNTMSEYNNQNYSIKTFNANYIVYSSIFDQVCSNYNINIIYRIYTELLGLSKKIKYISDKNDRNDADKKLKEFFNRLIKYKNEFNYLIKSDSKIKKFLKKLLMYLMLNKITFAFTYYFYRKMK